MNDNLLFSFRWSQDPWYLLFSPEGGKGCFMLSLSAARTVNRLLESLDQEIQWAIKYRDEHIENYRRDSYFNDTIHHMMKKSIYMIISHNFGLVIPWERVDYTSGYNAEAIDTLRLENAERGFITSMNKEEIDEFTELLKALG